MMAQRMSLVATFLFGTSAGSPLLIGVDEDKREDIWLSRKHWLELRRRSHYTPQLQVLPWGFIQRISSRRQEIESFKHDG